MSKMIDVTLELHKHDQYMLLNPADILNYIGENTEDEVKLGCYIGRWCEYLNLGVTINKEMAFDDGHRKYLSGWIDGYAMAMGYLTERIGDTQVVMMGRKHRITLKMPYEMKGEQNGS